ncbi:Topless-related protein 1 [Nymphaea thermarum]|nr:Topless-related protein 1 [Nymphaea thermarum]
MEAAAGVLIQQLWEIVRDLFTQSGRFRRQYRRLEQELGIVKLMLAISPSAESNEVLGRGGELMEKCSKVFRWNFFKQKKYSRRLKKLDEEIDKFLRMQTLRELQELKSMMSGAGGHRPNMGVGQRRGLRPIDSRPIISGRQWRVKRRPCIAIARAQHRQTCGKRRERLGTNMGDIALWEVGSREKLVVKNFKVWDHGAVSMPLQLKPSRKSVSSQKQRQQQNMKGKCNSTSASACPLLKCMSFAALAARLAVLGPRDGYTWSPLDLPLPAGYYGTGVHWAKAAVLSDAHVRSVATRSAHH